MTTADPGDKVCDLVLAGGDVKAAALVGAVSVLLEAGYAVNRVAGTSSGAVVAALVAADLGPDELLAQVEGLDVGVLADFRTPARVLPRWLGWPVSVLRWGSLCRGERLRSWLGGVLGARGVVRFDDLAPPRQPTGLPPVTGRDRLTVVAVDVSSGRLRSLPRDLAVYGAGSDLPVVEAVAASAAVPFFYPPARVTTAGRAHRLVDGGIASTIPVTTFDAPPHLAPLWPTFGISLSPLSGPADEVYATDGLRRFSGALLATMRSFHDRLALDTPAVRERVIQVQVPEMDHLDFDIDPARLRALVAAGRDAARAFLAGWDEQAYLERRAKEAEAYRTRS